MAQEPTVAAPAFRPGQPIEQLVLPVAAGSYHDRAMPLVVWLAERWNLPIRVVHVAGPADTASASAAPTVTRTTDRVAIQPVHRPANRRSACPSPSWPTCSPGTRR